MSLKKLKLLMLPAALLFAAPALSQQLLTEGQIIQNLDGVGQAAANVGVNVAAVRQEIEEAIRVEGTENAAAPRPVLQELQKLPNLIIEIQFDFDSDRIQPASYETLGLIADALHHPILLSDRFLVAGHTDAKGAREYNLKLSQRRADAVVEALTTTFNVPTNQLVGLGVGEEQLQNTSDPYAAVNRRVQLLNLGPR